jgi:hypothetical protein
MRRIVITIAVPLIAILLVSGWYFGARLADTYLETESVALRRSVPPVDWGFGSDEVNFEPTYSCQDFRSVADAKRALEKRYNNAGLGCSSSRLIVREPKLNRDGQRVGLRIEAIIGCGIEGQRFAVIWWTEGPRFCQIEAPLITQAEALEKTRT